MAANFSFEAELWMWHGEGAWYFVTLPVEEAAAIKEITASHRRGFGSVRVRVSIDDVSWSTSIFPDTKGGSYLLPVKKEVRQKCGIEAGDTVRIAIVIEGT